MLSRTASSLFWLARYLERVDATARMISMGQRMAMLSGVNSRQEWMSVLRASGAIEEESETVTKADVVFTLLLDPDYPGSIHSGLVRARNNGKSVRTAITQDLWEILNEDWRYLENMDTAMALGDLETILDRIRRRVSMFWGALETSMLRDDRYKFLKLGGYLERADMTLRLLNVKYFVLLPEVDVIGGGRDHHQWTSLLRAWSAYRAYHHMYKSDHTPWKIADFLILNDQFPRSVKYCYGQMCAMLDELAVSYGTEGPLHTRVRSENAYLKTLDMDGVFQNGLHEFLEERIRVTEDLNSDIAETYLF